MLALVVKIVVLVVVSECRRINIIVMPVCGYLNRFMHLLLCGKVVSFASVSQKLG